MKSIGVCIVINGHYVVTKNCVKNLIAKSNGANLRFYILDNVTKDKRVEKFFKPLCEGFAENENPIRNNYFIKENKRLEFSSAYNKLFQQVKEDYICVFPYDVIVNENWATDLLYAIENIEAVGIVAIRTSESESHITSLLSIEEKMETVRQTNDNVVDGVCLFRKDTIHIIGGYDKQLENTGYEQSELCFRFVANGFINNFYVFGQNAIKLNAPNLKTEKGLEYYNDTINAMTKLKIYKKQF